MKTKTLSIVFALVMVLSMSVGVFAQDFTETWDENTVLTVFSDMELYFPDMFANEDSDFLWADGPSAYPNAFGPDAKAVDPSELEEKAAMSRSKWDAEFSYDPCGDGLIKFDVTLYRQDSTVMYKGDENTSYTRNIEATANTGEKISLKKCESTGGDDCHSITFRKQADGSYAAHIKGYLYYPNVLDGSETITMTIDYSTYMTALWPVETPKDDFGTVTVSGTPVAGKKDYCQDNLLPYDAFGYYEDPGNAYLTRAKYDENTGEARLQVVIRNYQDPDYKKTNFVIPADVTAFYGLENQRITDYVCKYTVYNVANAAPRTDYCKFGEGIAIAPHAMIRLDLTIDHLSGDILRAADGDNIPFNLRIGGLSSLIPGEFQPVEFPCPVISRMVVKDPLRPFMTFFGVTSDPDIAASGPYGVYEGALWGMYQKCGKYAYMMVRLKNDGIKEEVINLNHTSVAINGGTPMSWMWVMTTVAPEKGNKIVLDGGQEVILVGRAKVTDIPSQLNADTAMTGAVNFTDFGFYLTGKVYSDHNNTRCVAAPK